ncbi:MAG: hypothetical protein LC685_04685 [Actinobacteria bacterium]|nr:hypothetical protein [Actinomycetota bacterium]
MTADEDPTPELIGLAPDRRLLSEDLGALPESAGHPVALPPSRLRPRLVAAGAAMTGLTLTAGTLLLILGAVLLVAGGSGGAALAALVAGGLLVSTHWGWVHVAEIGSQRLEQRGHRELVAARDQWLSALEPYPRRVVHTRPTPDGGVEVVTTRHQPRRASRTTFTFERREVGVERHGPDEPAAVVAERAELLRRQAAEETRRAQERYAVRTGERQIERMRELDAGDQRAADRAAAEALSEQINAHLRSPPVE